MADRISFMAFRGFPDPFPDSRTIWLFTERIAETAKKEMVWAELQRQLDAMGLQAKRGTIQDATFIEADPGPSRNHVVMRPRHVEAKMVPGLRKEKNSISAINCTKKPISITA
jgi:IS5 family transposase